MHLDRRTVLVGLLALLGLIAGAILSDVLGTVFFAITIAYVLVPLYRQLIDRGIPPWWASATATTIAFVVAVLLFLPIVVSLYLRRRQLLAILELLPDQVPIEAFGFVYVVQTSDVLAFARQVITGVAIDLARAAPVIAIKAFLFALIVFALLLRGTQLRRALLAPVPVRYHDIIRALNERISATLFALYVVQAATAAGTFLIALPVFVGFGYGSPIVLAVIAAVLQFLPIIGPSVLIGGLAIYELSVGTVFTAALVFVVGIVLIGVLPDVAIRPRLARETANLPGSLYFVGFTGGLLSLGPVGIIAGPLVVAVLVEILSLLSDEMRTTALTEFQS